MKMILATAAIAFAGLASAQEIWECGCSGDPVADLNRIEYQIPLNSRTLRGNTVGEVENHIEFLDEILEDNLFYGVLDMKKDKTKSFVRRDRTKVAETVDRRNRDFPRGSSIKYRQTIDVGFGQEKYQNDFSFQMGAGTMCAMVQPAKDYEHVFGCKTESNMFAEDTMCDPDYMGMQKLDYTVDGGNGYTGKLEFDDDDQWGTGDNDMVTMVDEDCFTNWPYDCELSCLDDFFPDACKNFYDGARPSVLAVGTDKDVFNFVREIKFEINREIDGEMEEVSEGKFVWQVRYDTWQDWLDDKPTGRETELSVKAYRDDTEEGEWDYVVDVCNQIVDAITMCGYPWIKYPRACPRRSNPDECPSLRPTLSPTHSPGYVPMCCGHQEGEKQRWIDRCPELLSEAACLKGRKATHCEWKEC